MSKASQMRAARNAEEWAAHGVAAETANRAIRAGKRGVLNLLCVKVQDAEWAELARKKR
jgi:hypothetical protein